MDSDLVRRPDLYAKVYAIVADAYIDKQGHIVVKLVKTGKLHNRIKSLQKIRAFEGKDTIIVFKHYVSEEESSEA